MAARLILTAEHVEDLAALWEHVVDLGLAVEVDLDENGLDLIVDLASGPATDPEPEEEDEPDAEDPTAAVEFVPWTPETGALSTREPAQAAQELAPIVPLHPAPEPAQAPETAQERPSIAVAIVELLAAEPDVLFTGQEIRQTLEEDHGFSRRSIEVELSRQAQAGAVERVSRGLYRHRTPSA